MEGPYQNKEYSENQPTQDQPREETDEETSAAPCASPRPRRPSSAPDPRGKPDRYNPTHEGMLSGWCVVYREVVTNEYVITAEDVDAAQRTCTGISLKDIEIRMRKFLSDWKEGIFHAEDGTEVEISPPRRSPTFSDFAKRIDALGGSNHRTSRQKVVARSAPSRRTPYPPPKRDREAVQRDRRARGAALKEQRLRLGFTQATVADRAGVSKVAVADVESGCASEKSIARVEEVLDALRSQQLPAGNKEP